MEVAGLLVTTFAGADLPAEVTMSVDQEMTW
jgi:hypothetical protein